MKRDNSESYAQGDVNLGRATVPPALHDRAQRKAWQLPDDDTTPRLYMIELNLLYREGLQKAAEAFNKLYTEVLGEREARQRKPVPISKSYFKCSISVNEWKALTKKDEGKTDTRDRVIYRIWPDFPVPTKKSVCIEIVAFTGSHVTLSPDEIPGIAA